MIKVNRRGQIAAATVLAAAGAAAAVIPASSASAATAAPAAVRCSGWHTVGITGNHPRNKNVPVVWGNAQVANSSVGGTCIRNVREYVHYPRTERLNWSMKVTVDGRVQDSGSLKHVHGVKNHNYYWTFAAQRDMPGSCPDFTAYTISLAAGSGSTSHNGPTGACLQ